MKRVVFSKKQEDVFYARDLFDVFDSNYWIGGIDGDHKFIVITDAETRMMKKLYISDLEFENPSGEEDFWVFDTIEELIEWTKP